MRLENIVFDASDPRRLGRFWETALGAQTLTDNEHGFETRLSLPGDQELDLCFQPVPEPPSEPVRLHLDLLGGPAQAEVVERLTALGAEHLDIGQGEVPWVVLADVEGNAFCVMEGREVYANTGPIAALPLDSADPERDGALWEWLSGWVRRPGVAPVSLQHPLGGPVLELCPEVAPKEEQKNRLHLDFRLDPSDDIEQLAQEISDRGGREIQHDWGDLPWRVFADSSGNEFCLLSAPPS